MISFCWVGLYVEAAHVALPRRRVRKQPMRPAHGLRGLQVRVAGHEQVDLGRRARRRDANQLHEVRTQRAQLVAQP